MKLILITQLLLVTLASFILTGCGGADDVESLIAKADAAISEGDLTEAESILRFALREDQRDPQVLARMGDVFMKQGRLRDAFQVLSLVKQLAPDDANSLASLASIELAAGMRDAALADARKALELAPSHSEAPIVLAELASTIEAAAQTKEWLETFPKTAAIHSAIGSLYLKSRNLAAADENFEQAIALEPDSPLGYAGKFQILLSQQKEDEAMASFRKAVENAPHRSGIRIRYAQILQQTEGDEAAQAVLDEILQNAPDYLPALSIAAELSLKMGDAKKAKAQLNSALKLDPIDPTAMRVNSALLIQDGKIDEAIELLEQALELYPQDVKANYQAALAYLAKRDLGKAKSRLTKVIQLAPNHMESNALLSTIQAEEEDYSGAIITLETFLKKNPNSMQAYLLLAEVYNRKGDSAAAVAIYKMLEESNSENTQLSYLTGLSYLQGQNARSARGAFEAALATNPLHFQSVEQLTALDLRERNFDDALARIDQTIAASPNTSVLHTIRAQILETKGDLDAATEAYQKSIDLDPKNRTARSLYARMLFNQGDQDGAFEQYQAILESNPEDVGTLTSIASAYEAREDFKQAAETYESILAIDAQNLAALNNLAYLYSTKFEKMDKALELAQKARAVAPNNPYTADTLGWIVFKKGDYRWALSLLQDSYNKLPEFPEVAYHLASTHYMLGNVDEAERLLKAALDTETRYTGIDDAETMAQILAINPQAADAAIKATLEARINSVPSDAMALIKKAGIAQNESKSDQARKLYSKALELSPENSLAMVLLGEILYSEESYAEAQKLAQQALTLKESNKDASFLLAKVALKTNQYDWAVSLLQGIAGTYQDEPSLRLVLGEAHYQLGNAENAIRNLKAAIDSASSPQSREHAQALLSVAEVDTDQFSPEAQALLEQRLASSPQDAQAIATLATLKIRSGELKEARSDLEEALKLSPENRLAKLGLAEILVVEAENPTRSYALTSAARAEPSLQNRAIALQALSLSQQGKVDTAKRQASTVDLNKLPAELREKVEELMAD